MARHGTRLLVLVAAVLVFEGPRRWRPQADQADLSFVGRCGAAARGAGRLTGRQAQSDGFEEKREALKECLAREYRSFFRPFEAEFYDEDVSFTDPLNKLSGKASYKANVEMLSGESLVGNILFSDGFIDLHGVEEVPGAPTRLRTRWTLGFVFKLLPWKPRALFSGVSEYEIDGTTAKVLSQRDYWDTLSLQRGGEYVPEPPLSGLKDLVGQLMPGPLRPPEACEPTAAEASGWVLLRRAAAYRIYRSSEGGLLAIPAPGFKGGLSGVRAEMEAHGLTAGQVRQTDGVQCLELVEPNPWMSPEPALQTA